MHRNLQEWASILHFLTTLILPRVIAWSKNCHFRVFIMISIGQTHAFLKDYVHMYQMGSHFVGCDRLDFFADRARGLRHHFASFWLSVVLDCLRRNKVKSSQISQFLIKMSFLHTYVEKSIKSALPTQKTSKTKLFSNFIYANLLSIHLIWKSRKFVK